MHPVVDHLPEDLRPEGRRIYSFDDLYEASQTFAEVYQTIVERVLELGRRPQGVVYAVPGHPYVAEATCSEIIRRAQAENLPVRVVEGTLHDINLRHAPSDGQRNP